MSTTTARVEQKKKIVDGIDVGKFEEFRKWLIDNPSKGILGLEATAFYEGQVGRSLVHLGSYSLDDKKIERPTRHYTIPFGAWREVEEAGGVVGATDRIEPVETTLAALAACLNVAISFNAAREGIKIEGLETHVEAKADPRGLFAITEDLGACFMSVKFHTKVKGELSEEELKKIERFLTLSPVHTLVSNPVAITGKVTLEK